MNSQLPLKHKEAVVACFTASRTQNTHLPVCPNWLERSAVSAGVRVPLQRAAVIPTAGSGSRTQTQTYKKDYRNESQPSKDSIPWRTLLFWAVKACSRCWTGSTWEFIRSLWVNGRVSVVKESWRMCARQWIILQDIFGLKKYIFLFCSCMQQLVEDKRTTLYLNRILPQYFKMCNVIVSPCIERLLNRRLFQTATATLNFSWHPPEELYVSK